MIKTKICKVCKRPIRYDKFLKRESVLIDDILPIWDSHKKYHERNKLN